MIAISIRQPWAELIMRNSKTIDIRKSVTSYRGILVIHAASMTSAADFKKANLDPKSRHQFTKQAFIGTVELVDIVRLNENLWEQLRSKHLVPGKWRSEDHKYAWFLQNPQRIRPISYKGLPRFFEVDEKVADKILRAIS